MISSKSQEIDWDNSLPTIAMALRATEQSATKLSPYEIVYGHKMNMPNSILSKGIEM